MTDIVIFVRKQEVKLQEYSYIHQFLTVVKNWKSLKGGDDTMNSCDYGSCSSVCLSADSRRFFTREEKLEMLKEYKEALEKETQGVKERITELEKK
ncbi:MAG: hypothetical protein AABY00_00600 [Nanoarchaeota archaeon]